MSDLERLYQERIRQHAGAPCGYRQEIAPTHRHEEYNPLCGDRIDVLLRIEHGTIEAAAFDGEACTICMASASMLCAAAAGQPVHQLLGLSARLEEALEPGSDRDPPGELAALGGVRQFPSRVRCATLPWNAARKACTNQP